MNVSAQPNYLLWFAVVMCFFGLAASVGPDDDPITVFLAGDSTMAEKRPEARPETGWGEALQAFFNVDEVVVENHARNGRSTRSFIEEGLWDALIAKVDRGDYVFVQFGHNDQSPKKVDRYAPPEAYKANLKRFVEDVRAKEAEPVLLTPVVRRRFDDNGHFYDVHGIYPELVREVAAEMQAPLIDMHASSKELLMELGPERSKSLFLWLEQGENENYPAGLIDNTHFSPVGAQRMAELAITGLRQTDTGLAELLRPAATAPRR